MKINPRVIQFLTLTLLAHMPAIAYADTLQDQRLYRSAYYLGRGDAGIALSDDYEAIFYNPAGLAEGTGLYKQTVFLSPQVDLSIDTRNLVQKIALQKKNDPSTFRQHVGKNQHLGLSNFTGIVFRRAALGVIANTNNDFLLRKSEDEHGAEVLSAKSVTNAGITFSFAEKFFDDRLLVGLTAKYLNQIYGALDINVLDSQNIAAKLEGDEVQQQTTGLGADLGILLKFHGRHPFHVAATIENLGETRLKPAKAGGAGRYLKQVYNLGFAYTVNSHLSHMKLALDFRDVGGRLETNPYKRLHIGAELALGSAFGLTGGWNQGYPGGGLYLNLYLMRFDFGAYTQEMGTTAGARPDSRFFLRMMVKI
ncbi:MAG: conjugal transfer protein TraF [Oligoflexus sp.]